MIDKIALQKAKDRTAEWNAAGYDGAGISVWDMEDLSDHGHGTRRRILDAAPKATVYNANHYLTIKNNVLLSDTVDDGGLLIPADLFIAKRGISVLTKSQGKGGRKRYVTEPLYHALRVRHNLVLFNSAGNEGSEGVKGGALPESEAMYVGACVMFAGNPDDIRMAHYSSIGDSHEQVDFSTFAGTLSGTSFAAPYLAGIAALLQQRYGRDITSAEIYQYFRMCAQPIDAGHPDPAHPGYDYWSGYGLPILPPVSKRLVRMRIGSTEYRIDGQKRQMDVAPVILDSRTFVPISFIALALGAAVQWDGKHRKVTITRDGHVLTLWIGALYYDVDGRQNVMDTAPFILSGRTMVPVAFVAEALGCKIAWVNDLREVMIIEP